MAFNFPSEPQTKVSDIVFRTFAGFFGGVFGSLVLLIGVLLSGSFASSYLTAIGGEGIHPLFILVTIMMIYLALLISSLSSITFFYYCDRERYRYLLSTLSHVFALVTLLFLVSTPLSLLLSLQDFESVSIVALILMGVSIVFSVVTMEVVAGHKHLLLTLYSSIVALFSFFLLMLILNSFFGTTTYLLPVALPLCWAGFGFWQVAFEMMYQWLYKLSGDDYLNSERRIGTDYIKEQRLRRRS